MCKARWIALIVFFCICVNARSETPQAAGTSINDGRSSADEREVELSAQARQAAARAVDDAIEFSRRAGNEKEVAKWLGRKDQALTIGDVRGLLKVTDRLLDKNELQSAQQIYSQLQVVAESLRESFPPLELLVQLHLAFVDDAFERYDAALHRIDDLETLLPQLGTTAPEYQLGLNFTRGHLLRELGKYDEAERCDLRVVQKADKCSETTKDAAMSARFELRAVYADKGDFQKLADLGVAQRSEFYDDHGNVDSYRILLMLSSIVKYDLEGDKDLEEADRKCQDLIDRMKYYRGVSSPSYIEAIELMSKVRVAQSRNAEAVELLKKSSELRTGLFGPDHPSIARTQAELDRIRKLSLEVSPLSSERIQIRDIGQ